MQYQNGANGYFEDTPFDLDQSTWYQCEVLFTRNQNRCQMWCRAAGDAPTAVLNKNNVVLGWTDPITQIIWEPTHGGAGTYPGSVDGHMYMNRLYVSWST